ncbi:FtsX-like permease family protein [Shimazuella kribbensis]|uniref:FtsX-like permease family protein n=1 Tax=Shimazuella kribbensis TaxID=139808 RepID=UPI0004090BF4|nr:ABC transporter permease [Shimazuella kribbensis]
MTFTQLIFRNMIRNYSMYLAYFFSCVLSILSFFVYTLFVLHPQLNNRVVLQNAVDWMYGASWIIYTFALFFILYSIQIFLQNRHQEFGIWFMQGMSIRQFRGMIFYENLCIGISSIVVGIVCGISIEKLFLLVSTQIMDISILEFYFPWKAIFITIEVYVFLFIVLAYGTPFLMRKKKIVDYLYGRKQGDQSKKVSIFLSILSIVFLTLGYYLAFVTSKSTIISNISPILLLIGIGTYFFFTQLIPLVISLFKTRLAWYWKKTNFLAISNLSITCKNYAPIFFIITIIYTVSFCMLGTFASSQALNKQFRLDYPLDVGYIAKSKEKFHLQNILKIKQELSARGIHYTTYQSNIKYIPIKSMKKKSYTDIPVISYTDYKNMLLQSGQTVVEPSIKGNEVIGLLTSQLDSYLTHDKYHVKNTTITLYQEKMGKYVTIPWRLLQSQALIVSDDMFARFNPSKSATFTGFYSTAPLTKTLDLGKTLVREGRIMPSDQKPYSMIVSGTLYKNQIHLFRILFFIIFLIAIGTFVASGSFVYLQLLSNINKETEHFIILQKIGLSEREWNKTITFHLGALFFLPITIAVIHSIFALIVLQNYFIVSITSEWIIVITTFLVGQLFYFLIIRKRYSWNVQKTILN